MKRAYSSPVMEVEVFEASEYVAACATVQGKLWLETNKKPGLQTSKEYDSWNNKWVSPDTYISDYWICKNTQHNKYGKTISGYLVSENSIIDVKVFNKHGQYHIINTNSAPNMS